MLGEALNNLTDIVVVTSTMLSVRIGEKGGDLDHPFGHRRLKSVVSLIVAVVFITITSFQLIQQAVTRLFKAPAASGDIILTFAVLVGSFILNLVPLPFLMAPQNRQNISIKTNLVDTINDSLSLIVSMIGLGLIYWGYPLGDPIATIIIALVIAFDAYLLIKENFQVLLGQSPEPEFYDRVKDVVLAHDEVLGVHDMIGEHIGPDAIHMDFDLELDPQTSLEDSDKVVGEVKSMIDKEFDKELNISIHPCSHQGEHRRIHSEL